MVAVTVLYPQTESSHFDYEYYAAKHLPLVKARWGSMGLEEAEFLRGSAAMDGAAPAFALIATLVFSSQQAMNAALAAHGAEILGDIPNYTDVQPLMQVNAPLAV